MGLSNRFYNRAIRRNDSDIYEEIIKENRGLPNGLDQYTTAEFNYPTAQQITNLTLLNHIWRVHDKFYKLSYEYYGDSRFWWAIAWFNMKPTRSCENRTSNRFINIILRVIRKLKWVL
jgi:hypothetical protein